jgi:hypothetical protein
MPAGLQAFHPRADPPCGQLCDVSVNAIAPPVIGGGESLVPSFNGT